MDTAHLPPDLAPAITFRWTGGAGGALVEAVFPPDFADAPLIVRAVLPAFFAVGHWPEISQLTEGIHLRLSYTTDLRGVVFLDGDRPEYGGMDRVGLYIEDGTENEALMPQRDFLTLAARWLTTLRDGALAAGDLATQADWWPAWSAQVDAIARDAAAS